MMVVISLWHCNKASIHSYFLLQLCLTIITGEKIWNPNESYDFVVVGAGAAGSAVSTRLSENEKYQVLLLEAGGEPPFFVDIPYLGMGPFGGEYDWAYWTEKQDNACLGYKDQKWFVPRGKGLGGTTLINGMIFTRGNKNDFDHWKNLGNDGWGYEDVLPYFKKLEDYQGPMKPVDEIYHGKGGPVTVSVAEYKTPLQQTIFNAVKELGYSFSDYNAQHQTGVFYSVATVRNGSRCNAYTAYLKPNRNRTNLHIVTKAFMTKVAVDDQNKVLGVHFVKGSEKYFVPVKKEVILSAGSNNSPHILMLSGIGPKLQLEKFKINVVKDLPGVGENLQDHVVAGGVIFKFKNSIGFNFLKDINQDNLELWLSKREGPLSVAIHSEAVSFMNSKYADQQKNWPDYEFQFIQPPVTPFNLKEEYEVPFHAHDSSRTLLVLPVLLRPKSVGHVRLQSDDPHIPLGYQPKYLTVDNDVAILVDAVKTALKLMKTKPFVDLGTTWGGSFISGCKEHEEFSDEYIECYIRHYNYGLFHQSGTCKMGNKSDPLAVVDSRLRVYGVKGLRIADVSISPSIASGHTMAAAYMIGEKAASTILEDWQNKHDEF